MVYKPSVVYWNNIPAPYMVERFNAIADRNNLDFEAWFNERTHVDRSWKVNESDWRFSFRYLQGFSFAGKKIHLPFPLLKKKSPDVLVSLYAEPSFLFGWAIAKLRCIKAGFWAEITFDRWVKRTPFKEILKKWLFPRVDFFLTVGDDGRKYIQKYGTPIEKIFFAPHAIDVSYFTIKSTIERQQANKILGEYDDTETVFIYVGRLLKKKGLDYLLDAFKEVQHRSEYRVKLILVGDGVDQKFFQQRCKIEGIENVTFSGFFQRSELPKIYAAADVFVFPSLGDPYGLVIDEAMACMLPIIATSSIGELYQRLANGVNGYVVPPENSHHLANSMLLLSKNPDMRKKMGEKSVEKISRNSPEKWAIDFEQIVLQILNRK